MARLFPAFLLLLCSSLPSSHQGSPVPLQFMQSEKSYGPDGPWHAVSVVLGSPGQDIDLYPGGASYGSAIFTNLICRGISDTPCGSGGLFNPSNSASAATGDVSWEEITSNTTKGDWTGGALLYQYNNASYAQDNMALNSAKGALVESVDLYMFSTVSMRYPGGTQYPVQVGQLALGNPDGNQTFATSPGEPAINGTLVPSYLYAHNIIPSSSYGLHYGAAALKLDLSLWLGGYDLSRVLGPIASQSYTSTADNSFVLTLQDITIGVDHGASPFSYPSREGILGEGNQTITDGIPILINPAAPYLNLPNSTCAAITKDLPVTYNSSFGLYLWNVSDPQYGKIVSSPTYLSFIFNTQNPVNLTIKVPFQLLNLTLEAPLTTAPTQYFPCQPPQDPSNQQYGLGRAFLQAAFLGVNWSGNAGQWYLAQAPGPGVSMTPDQRPITTDSAISASSVKWADTWQNHWSPLPSTTSSSGPQTGPSGGAMAGGAIAGIAIGVVGAVVICFAIGFFVYRRRTSSNSTPLVQHMLQQNTKSEDMSHVQKPPPVYAAVHDEPLELHHDSTVIPTSELSGSALYEMSLLSSPAGRSG